MRFLWNNHSAASRGSPDPERNHDHDLRSKDFGFLPIPRSIRHDPQKPFYFGTLMNISFGFAGTFLVANLYYCQPLLIQLSHAFQVSYNEVSRIPTLVQAGYAVGLFLIAPLGDLVRSRQLILVLVMLSTALTIGLAVTNSLVVFEVLSFLIGGLSMPGQILLPLAADLAPPERRASAISVVLSGLLFGILIARVLAGLIAQFASWRVVYYMAIGAQGSVLAGCYFLLPDYPARNSDNSLTYWNIIWSMTKFAFTEPLLIQASLVNITASACYSNFWVTLTFLLGGAPYYYSTLIIGLFGLVGMVGVAAGPFIGQVIDQLVPWYAALCSSFMLIIFQGIQTGAGGINVAAVVISTIGLDIFRQTVQVSLSSAVFEIDRSARSRLNAVMVIAFFIGQVMGSSVGTEVFLRHGWRAGAALGMAWYGLQFVFLLVRGPHCRRFTWVGFEGGLEARKSVVEARKKKAAGSSTTAQSSTEEKDTKSALDALDQHSTLESCKNSSAGHGSGDVKARE